jgi:hypothetical protein
VKQSKFVALVVVLAVFVLFSISCAPCITSNSEEPKGEIRATVSDVRTVSENDHVIACSFTARFGAEDVAFRLTGNEGSFGHDNVHLCATLREGDIVKIYDNSRYYIWSKYSTSKK